MKKLLSLILALSMLLIAVGCGANKNTEAIPEEEITEAMPAEEVTEAAPEKELTENETENSAESTGKTLGQTLLNEFNTLMASDENKDITSIADTLIKHPSILFSGATMPIEPGLLAGFGNTEITGFKEGISFAPMIGTIPFMGYIFQLEEGADVEAFKELLKSNADLRWNICTEADELVVESSGNTVFFLMCPASLEE